MVLNKWKIGKLTDHTKHKSIPDRRIHQIETRNSEQDKEHSNLSGKKHKRFRIKMFLYKVQCGIYVAVTVSEQRLLVGGSMNDDSK